MLVDSHCHLNYPGLVEEQAPGPVAAVEMNLEALSGDLDRHDRNTAIELDRHAFRQARPAEPRTGVAVVERQRHELEQLVAEDAVPFGLRTAHIRHCNEIDVLEADVADRDLRGAEHRACGDGASRSGRAYLADLRQAQLFGQRHADPSVSLRACVDRKAVRALAADRHLDHRDCRRQERNRGAFPGYGQPRNVLRHAWTGQHERRPGKYPTDPHDSSFRPGRGSHRPTELSMNWAAARQVTPTIRPVAIRSLPYIFARCGSSTRCWPRFSSAAS